MISHGISRSPDPVCPTVSGATCQDVSATRHTMARLRAATSAAHVRIEKNPRLAALLRPGLSQRQYQDVLLRYHAYFARVEPSMFAVLSRVVPTIELDRRRKTPLLERDLSMLDIAVRPVQPDPLEVEPTYAQALGRLYVHEGASLGGRLIHAALRRNTGHMHPCAFFAGYGSETAEVWRATQVILAAGCTGESELIEATEAANAAFHEIESIMAQ